MTDITSTPDTALPTDADLNDQIVNFDMADFPSQHQIIGDVRLPPVTKVTALAPADRESILAELATYPPSMREDKEAELVQKKVEELAIATRLRSGPGADATPFQKTAWEIHREVSDLNTQVDKIIAELTEVSHIDPVTKAETLRYPFGSLRRAGLDGELERLGHRLALLKGSEGSQRLEAARAETAQQIRDQMQERIDLDEVQKRAAHIFREEALNRRAATKAKFLKGRTSIYGT